MFALAPKKLKAKPVVPNQINGLEEYMKVATQVGVIPAHIQIEKFKDVLAKLNYPVYNLNEVIKYMDKKCAQEGVNNKNQESKPVGWCWKPVRDKDSNQHIQHFGTRWNEMRVERLIGGSKIVQISASHYFAPSVNGLYPHTVPLHALKRIAAIEEVYSPPLAFVISDYAPKPHFNPDPFLMAIVPNGNIGGNQGMFVIDFWDEPGFGIEQMLK